MKDTSLAPYQMDLTKALSEPPPPPDDVVPGLRVGTVGALVAPGGVGKTMFALGLAIELACGVHRLRQVFGLSPKGTCKPQPVALVVTEETESEVHRRIWSFMEAMHPTRGKLLRPREEMAALVEANLAIFPIGGRRRLRLDEQGPATDLKALNDAAQGKRLLVVDPLRQVHGGDEMPSEVLTDIVQKLQTIAVRQSCAALVCHHANKASILSETGHMATATRGTTAFTDAVRWQMNLSEVDDAFARRYKVQEAERHRYVRLDLAKSNYLERIAPALLHRGAGGVLCVEPRR